MIRRDASRHRPLALAALIVLLGVTAPAGAATFRVGDDGIGPCTHTTLGDAVAAAAANGSGSDQIFLSVPVTLSAPLLIINQEVEIVGGFVDCADNDPGTSRTVITVATNDAIFVFGSSVQRAVTLQNLRITRPAANPLGRILRIQDASFVTLANTRLDGGSIDNGGNVFMSGPSTFLRATDWLGAWSQIAAGEAIGIGGGIYCEAGGTVLLERVSLFDNHAGVDGGGLYLNGCTLDLYAGQTEPAQCGGGIGGGGVACNHADRFGGGIYATAASEVRLLGSAARPASVAKNVADEGGGFYLLGAGTTVVGENAWLVDNSAAHRGGAAYVRAGAALTLSATAGNCDRLACSLVESNAAAAIGGVGGAFAVDSGGDLAVFQTTIRGNSADVTGSVVHASGGGSTALIEGALLLDNFGSLNAAYIDTFDGAEVTMAFSTFDEDTGCCKALFDTNTSSAVRIFSSILLPLFESTGAGRVFDESIAAGETREADCLLYQESSPTLPPAPPLGSFEVVTNVPALFANWAARDLRLRAGSQAVDFCDTFSYLPLTTDVELQARGFDVPTIPNNPFGSFDLGADEWHALFVADHEEGDCSDWSLDTGGC